MRPIISNGLVLVAVATQALAAPQNMKQMGQCAKSGSGNDLFDVVVVSTHSRGGYCELNSCEKIPAGQNYPHPPMTIKSLTTRLSDGRDGPTSCMDVTFDMKIFKKYRTNLTYFWPSFDPYVKDEDIWRDQLEKYGSCIQCQLAKDDNELFFYLASLNGELILAVLIEKKIIQSYENPVLLQSLKDSIKMEKLHFVPEFFCKGKRKNLDVLQEIRYCFRLGSSGFDYTKCPSTESPTCQTENVWFLGNSSITQVPSTIVVIFMMLFAHFISKGQ